MCGICAAVSLGDSTESKTLPSNDRSAFQSLSDEVDNGLACVKHRGPDAEGKWISTDGRTGLGHVRLSIIDLAPTGNQPFHDTATKKIHAVVNGELYDHERIKAELTPDYEYLGNSDSEIVIALYKRYGLSLMAHLRGEFAFVLWDEERQLLFAARDRYGIKPLYYTVVDSRLLVATEMKSFLAFGWKPEWNVQAIVDHGWRIDGRTMFKGVRKVLPGHYLISKHHEPVEEKPYWDIEYPDKYARETRTEKEMIEGVRERMVEAVRLRLRADVPIGIYLSGGLDSSAVAGITAHLKKERATRVGSSMTKDMSNITCLCVQFDKASGMDESEVAQRTAQSLGATFLPILMDDEALANSFEDAVWYSETVMPDANGPGRMMIAERAHREGLRCVLTGEGADEHFGGYLWLAPEAIREPDLAWLGPDVSSFDREAAVNKAESQFGFSFGGAVATRPDSTSRMLNGNSLTKRLATLTPVQFAPWTECYSDTNQETLVIESLDGRVREAIRSKWHPLHAAQYMHTKTTFQNLLLRYVGDNVDMVHRIESRTPFLDHHFTEYANSIPPSLKVKYNPQDGTFNEKYILKEAMRPFIPEEIYRRKKHSFVGPTKFKPNGSLRKVLERLVTHENIDQLGFLDWARTKDLVGRAFDGEDGAAFRGAMAAAQFVVLGQRFGVRTAAPPSWHQASLKN